MAKNLGNKKWKDMAERLVKTRKRSYSLAELKQEFLDFVAYYTENTITYNQRKKQRQKGAVSADGSNIEVFGDRVEKLAPMTEHAFCLWLGKCKSWFPQTIKQMSERENKSEEDEEYLEFLLQVQTFLSTQVLEGAILGEYTPTLIAQLLGMKSNVDVTSDDKPLVPVINIVEDTKTREDYDTKKN